MLATLLRSAGVSDAVAQDAADILPGVSVDHLKMERNGEYLTVEMNVDLAALDVEANRAVLLTPRLVNGPDSLDLSSIGIYGRRRYYYYLRNGEGMLTGKDELSYKASEKPDDDYLHNTFIHNSSFLRIYNYVGDDLDFTDDAGFKWYVYDEELSNLTGGQYNFRLMDGRGFRWSELKTESGGGYKFDAIVFPHFHKYRSEVYADQRPDENFLASDILMAHHDQLESEYGPKVSQHFWHVLSWSG